MNTEKQKAIEKAWLNEVSESEYSRMKPFIEDSGFYADKFNRANITTVFSLNPNIQEKFRNGDTYSYSIYRPKTLDGVDNNCGWVKINEDGSNLPEDKGGASDEYLLGAMQLNGEFFSGNKPVFPNRVAEMFRKKQCTHYRIVVDIPAPIY